MHYFNHLAIHLLIGLVGIAPANPRSLTRINFALSYFFLLPARYLTMPAHAVRHDERVLRESQLRKIS
jgi:hypothetical protein